MEPLRVTIVSRRDCHLCGVVYRVAMQAQQDLSFDLITVDIDSDPRLLAQYNDEYRSSLSMARKFPLEG